MNWYIKKLIKEGEHQQQDFKFAINDSKKIARSLVAFSNTDGGRLLIGVKDNGAIVGVSSDEEYYMVEAAAHLYCKPEVKFDTKSHLIDGKTILEVNVKKSDQVPHYAPDNDGNWKVYVRVEDQNILANNIMLKVWERKKQNIPVKIRYTEAEKILFDYLDKNQIITLSKFYRIAYLPMKQAETIIVDLIVLGVLEVVVTEKQIYYRKKIMEPKNN